MALTYTRPDVKAGQYLRGADLEAILDQIDALTAGEWTAYTPTWTASTTNPAIGNGSISGRYRVAPSGNLVFFTFRIAAGATTTFGTGFWSVGLPTDPAPSATAQLEMCVGSLAIDTSLGNRYNLTGDVFASNLVFNTTASNLVTNTNPFAWATTDILKGQGWYEPA